MKPLKFMLKSGKERHGLKLDKKNILGIIKPSGSQQIIKNFRDQFRISLRNPDAGRPLASRLKPGQPAVIVVSDRTRESLASAWLPVLLAELNKAGVPDRLITVIFALGAHPGQTKEEQIKIIGREAARRVRFFDHNCHRNLVRIGRTARGTPVAINKRFLEAPNKILTGIITYHYFAGFTGGPKSILPGLASFEAIQKIIVFFIAKNGILKTAVPPGLKKVIP